MVCSLVLLLHTTGAAAQQSTSAEDGLSSSGSKHGQILVAEFAEVSDLVSLPGPSALQRIDLPHVWLHSNPNANQWFGYYRLDLPSELATLEKPSIYIPRWAHNAELILNGISIHQPGNIGQSLSRYWNRPQLVPLPHSALRGVDDRLEVRLQTNFAGYLSSVHCGEYESLQSVQKARYSWQIGVVQGLLTLLVSVTFFMLVLARFRRTEPLFLFCALSSGSWAWYLMGLLIPEYPDPERFFWGLHHFAIESAVYFLFLFCNRFGPFVAPRLEAWLGRGSLLLFFVYAVLPLKALLIVSALMHNLSTLLVVYLAVRHLRYGLSGENSHHLGLAVGMFLYCLFTWLDIWSHSP